MTNRPARPRATRPVGRPPGRPAKTVREIAPVYGGMEGILSRLNAIVETLGNNKTAFILRVSASQPSRWRSGKEMPSPDLQTAIIELDRVLARLFEDMLPRPGLVWLESYNDFLGTRPMEALALQRFDEVVDAIMLEEQGGFV